MAQVGALDFRGFITHKKAKLPAGGKEEGRSYAYVSDRHTRIAFDALRPLELAITAAVNLFKDFGKNEMLGHAVKVSPRQFPRVHRLVERCAETLGIAMPTVFIVNSPVMNAGTFGTNDDSFIMIHSALIDRFTDEELLSVIGHECGHIHNKHVVYLTAMNLPATVASIYFQWLSIPARMVLMTWLRRAEITCDRAGLLCSKDLDVSTRALTKLALGSSKLFEELDMEAFLEQHEEGKDGIGRFAEVSASHPWLPKRVLALRHFAQSELYRTHAKLGKDGISMTEVDKRVGGLVQVVR